MIKIYNAKDCCACGNCINVCPKQCISWIHDGVGFRFPKVDEAICVDCHKCTKVCPILNSEEENTNSRRIFSAYSKNKDIRLEGSSGGMFGTIARYFMENKDAIVYGAAFDDKLKLKTMSSKETTLKSLCKSKYLLCDTEKIFQNIKLDLVKGKKVVYVSTPCQVFALKLFLGKEYDNLITIDFVCHGVPSQYFFDKCKEYTERKKKIKILNYEFRTKLKKGATPHYFTIKYIEKNKVKQKTQLYTKDLFYLGFQKYITLRDSCYECKFSSKKRYSDITIGDFHNVDKYLKGINRFDGVSLVVINTEKGLGVWHKVKEQLIFNELNFDELYNNKELMVGPTERPKKQKEFIHDLQFKNFDFVVKKWLNSKKEWKKNLYYRMPKFIRQKVKKLMGM